MGGDNENKSNNDGVVTKSEAEAPKKISADGEKDHESKIVYEDPLLTEVEKIAGIVVPVEADAEERPPVVEFEVRQGNDDDDDEKKPQIVVPVRKKSTPAFAVPQVTTRVDSRSSVINEKKDQFKDQQVATQLRRSLMSLKGSVQSQKVVVAGSDKSRATSEVELPKMVASHEGHQLAARSLGDMRKSVVIMGEEPAASETNQTEYDAKDGEDKRHVRKKSIIKKRESSVTNLTPRQSYEDNCSVNHYEGLTYQLQSRIRYSQPEDILKGFVHVYPDEKDIESFETPEAEAEAEADEVYEEELDILDRRPYYEKHEYLQTNTNYNLVQSYVLQQKLSHFFRRRKMNRVLEEDPAPIGTLNKYQLKLVAYQETLDLAENTRNVVNEELKTLRERSSYMKQNLEKIFKAMQDRELEIGLGLINTKTGSEIPEKLVEKYIKRQKDAMGQVSSMLLKFLRLKYMVQEKLNEMSAIDEVSPGMRLTDYETLKLLNRDHVDKMEEKDELLCRLRYKCESTIQILAHLRDKGAEMEIDLVDLREDLKVTDLRKRQVRQKLNNLKVQRDDYRLKTNHIRQESGLLTYSTLLNDMEDSQTEILDASQQLHALMESHKIKSKLIRTLRSHIEVLQFDIFSKSTKTNLAGSKQGKHSSRERAKKKFKARQLLFLQKAERGVNRRPTRESSMSVDPYRFSTKTMSSITTVDKAQLRTAIVPHLKLLNRVPI